MKSTIKPKAPIEPLIEWVKAKKIVIGNFPPEEIAKKIQAKIS